MAIHTTEQVLGLVPVAVAVGISTRAMKSVGREGLVRRVSAVKRKPIQRTLKRKPATLKRKPAAKKNVRRR